MLLEQYELKKELIICTIIGISIIIGNIITQNYTKVCVSKMNEKIDAINQIVYNQVNLQQASNEKEKGEGSKINKKMVQDEISNLESTWNEFQEKLAYYIEHDELEKVETQIYAIKGFYEAEKYDEILPEAEKCTFILKHIEEKNKLSIKNIF